MKCARCYRNNMAGSSERILHQSVLELDNKQTNVILTPKYIAVEHIIKQRQNDNDSPDKPCRYDATVLCQVIPVEEIIAIHPHHANGKDKFKINKGGAVYHAVETQPMLPTAFDIFIIKRASKHRWRHKLLTFTSKEHSVCSVWIDKIREVLHASGSNRPRNLLVFVNPYGGKKRAPKVFEKVRSLFDLAGVTLEVIETQRQYHARDILQTYELSSVDGILCVGGDGTFSEVLNGLLDRSNMDERVSQTFRHQPARPRLRVGVIPAGSTDSIVYTTTGINDPMTSALQIIIGCSIGVDVNALYKQEEFVKYSVTMTSYGYYGDLLADSEKLRWMGPKRYNISGVKKFVSNKAYEGEVSFLPADKSSGHPQDGNTCFSECAVCQQAGRESEMALSKKSPVPMFDLGLGSQECLYETTKADEWCRVKGKFVAINTVTVSCRCSLSPEGMSPYTHLGDGCMDLILISDCSRLSYLKHLLRIPRPNSDQFDFNFIQVHRVREFQFRPAQDPQEEEEVAGAVGGAGGDMETGTAGSSPTLSKTGSSQKSMKTSSSQNSVWNCDGELVTHPNLHIQVHCQLIGMFARGVEDGRKREQEKCPVCCTPCQRC